MHELEAKFLTTNGHPPEGVLRRLQESLAWAGFRIQPRGRRSFSDRYYDTVDQQLRSAGWSYRERRDAQGRRIALKEVTRSRAAIFDREAVEQVVGRDEDLRRPGPGPVSDRLSNLLHPDAEIAPLFTVESSRAAYDLSHPDHPRGLVEMAFDDARVHAQESIEFKELALELKTGPHELLASILAAVELEPSLIEARLSKYERGLITAGCRLERRWTLKPSSIDKQSRWLDVGIAHLKAQLYQIKLHEPHAWEGLHVEGVHQMRVATRRARAALRAFALVLPADEARRVHGRLAWLTEALGKVRDLDVHLQHLSAYSKALKPYEQATLAPYRRHKGELHEAAHRRLIDALGSHEYVMLISDYRDLLIAAAQPQNASPLKVEDVARQSVRPLLERVFTRGRRITEDSPDKHRHKLRIDIKRLRYQLEFLEPAYRNELEPMLGVLKRLQNRLGMLQDARVAEAELERYRKQHALDQSERSVFKTLIRLEKKRARRHRERFPAEWQRFEEVLVGLAERVSG